MALLESGEMYLESVYILSQKQERVRATDVGEFMGFSKPSVSRAVGLLKADGYLFSLPDGSLALTPLGLSVAQKTYERHTVLTRFFIRLGVCERQASADACKIEHDISPETFEAVKKHAKEWEDIFNAGANGKKN